MTKKEARGCIIRTVVTWDCEFCDGHHEIRKKMPKNAEIKDIKSVSPIKKLYAVTLETFLNNAQEVID